MKLRKKPNKTVGDVKRQINAMRSTKRQNDDGTVSTHLMSWGGNDKEGYDVHPTIFPNKDGSWKDLSGEGQGWDAYDEAKKRGELIGGLSEEMARDIAEGSWKDMGMVKLKKKDASLFKNGGMIKRKDGSYSPRGVWDNIRKRKGSGKKPTKAMLEQEKKIKREG